VARVVVTAQEGVFPAGDAPERIASDAWRIPLPLPFALRSMNVYLLGSPAAGWTLVDSGLGLPADEAALSAGLDAAGAVPEAISSLILTHAHPDHIGLSGWIAAISGASVIMLAGEDDALFRVWDPASGPEPFDALSAMYAAHGLTPQQVSNVRTITERIRHVLRLPPRAAVVTVHDGETLTLGGHDYRIIWTPGHSDYQMVLLREDGLLLAGDHVLPHITPNIGWYPHNRPDPLRDYYESLAKVRDLPATRVLPGHGRIFANLAHRVDELRIHHDERAAQVRAIVAASPAGATAAEVARALFGDRLRNDDDRRFAVVESLAHLEHLRIEGQLARDERNGLVMYSAT
jgi:glyoxylase-like metal-dependent hydrolase (beta-lactamase superfamily II)